MQSFVTYQIVVLLFQYIEKDEFFLNNNLLIVN